MVGQNFSITDFFSFLSLHLSSLPAQAEDDNDNDEKKSLPNERENAKKQLERTLIKEHHP